MKACMPTVTDLRLKKKRGDETLKAVSSLVLSRLGIEGAAETLCTRHLLILPSSTLINFGLQPGDLRENVVLSGLDIHDFPSGTVVRVGSTILRLTYHCEPCPRIKHLVPLNKVLHRRGYLAQITKPGTIKIGDVLEETGDVMEPIPYAIPERLMWYLDKQSAAISIPHLAREVGLSQSYYRAIPAMIRKLDSKYQKLVDCPSLSQQPRLL